MPRSFRRFFVDSDFSDDRPSLKLSHRETFHLHQVLRLKPGDACRVFNSKGQEAVAVIETISEKEGTRLKLEKIFPSKEGRLHLKIGQALPQKGKMDTLVQKAEELGVHELWVLETERTVVKMKAEAGTRAQRRWERIVIEAAKQSGNSVLTRVEGPLPFKKVLEENLGPSDRGFIFHPDPAGTPFRSVIDELRKTNAPASLFLFLGPEGGFSEREVQEAESRGVRKVWLGDSILRLETAFLGVTAALRWMVNS